MGAHLAEDDVGVRGRRLEDVRLRDDEQDLHSGEASQPAPLGAQENHSMVCAEIGSAGLGRTFLLFFTVHRMMPGTGFIPSFCIAFRDFFSLRDCFPRPSSSSSSSSASSRSARQTVHAVASGACALARLARGSAPSAPAAAPRIPPCPSPAPTRPLYSPPAQLIEGSSNRATVSSRKDGGAGGAARLGVRTGRVVVDLLDLRVGERFVGHGETFHPSPAALLQPAITEPALEAQRAGGRSVPPGK